MAGSTSDFFFLVHLRGVSRISDTRCFKRQNLPDDRIKRADRAKAATFFESFGSRSSTERIVAYKQASVVAISADLTQKRASSHIMLELQDMDCRWVQRRCGSGQEAFILGAGKNKKPAWSPFSLSMANRFDPATRQDVVICPSDAIVHHSGKRRRIRGIQIER
ncbi:hypothetical protein MRBLMR1_002039 [Neorhizobium sp. LMR1-1-1.1]